LAVVLPFLKRQNTARSCLCNWRLRPAVLLQKGCMPWSTQWQLCPGMPSAVCLSFLTCCMFSVLFCRGPAAEASPACPAAVTAFARPAELANVKCQLAVNPTTLSHPCRGSFPYLPLKLTADVCPPLPWKHVLPVHATHHSVAPACPAELADLERELAAGPPALHRQRRGHHPAPAQPRLPRTLVRRQRAGEGPRAQGRVSCLLGALVWPKQAREARWAQRSKSCLPGCSVAVAASR